MNDEIDLELFTISIIRLNNAFQKLEDFEDEAIEMIKQSANDLENLYDELMHGLFQEEINMSEYHHFFQYINLTLPRYIDDLNSIEDERLNDCINEVIFVLNKINNLANSFLSKTGRIIWMKH